MPKEKTQEELKEEVDSWILDYVFNDSKVKKLKKVMKDVIPKSDSFQYNSERRQSGNYQFFVIYLAGVKRGKQIASVVIPRSATSCDTFHDALEESLENGGKTARMPETDPIGD